MISRIHGLRREKTQRDASSEPTVDATKARPRPEDDDGCAAAAPWVPCPVMAAAEGDAAATFKFDVPQSVDDPKAHLLVELQTAIAARVRFRGNPCDIRVFLRRSLCEGGAAIRGPELTAATLPPAPRPLPVLFVLPHRPARPPPRAITAVASDLFDTLALAVPAAIPGIPSGLMEVLHFDVGLPIAGPSRTLLVRPCLADIADAFLRRPKRPVCVVGQPGSGKSFAGAYFVHRCLAAGRELVVWLLPACALFFDAETGICRVAPKASELHCQVLQEFPNAVLINDSGDPLPMAISARGFTIVLRAPNMAQNFAAWEARVKPRRYVLGAWRDEEIIAACVALRLNPREGLDRAQHLAPLPLFFLGSDYTLGVVTDSEEDEGAGGKALRGSPIDWHDQAADVTPGWAPHQALPPAW